MGIEDTLLLIRDRWKSGRDEGSGKTIRDSFRLGSLLERGAVAGAVPHRSVSRLRARRAEAE